MRRRQHLGWIFDPSERSRRGGAQGSRKARGGVLERTLGCGSRAVRLRRAGGMKARKNGWGPACPH